MITIGVVDDKLVNRKTVQRNISSSREIEIVLEASNGSEFLEKMDELSEAKRPQVVLMDIDMPVMSGIETIAVGTIKFPNTRFLVLTVFDDDEKIFEAIQAGASGYLLKDDSATELADAITEALTFNGAPMSPAIARKTLSWLKNLPKPVAAEQATNNILSERELEIIKLMVDGHDYKAIAAKLFISPNTVRVHISKIYEKLHINSKVQAVQLAYKYKWV
jgi:DNA-binding NarL/FixJ family response regulator